MRHTEKLKAFGRWVLARLSERSTWTGIALVAAAFVGHDLAPTTLHAMEFVGPAVGGALFAYEERK